MLSRLGAFRDVFFSPKLPLFVWFLMHPFTHGDSWSTAMRGEWDVLSSLFSLPMVVEQLDSTCFIVIDTKIARKTLFDV